jgi:glycerophosphoryl diester phosphodiesterase
MIRIGHRGAAGHAPENTIAAIEKGIALGCDYVEIDVQLTADHQAVVMHDKRVDRTTNGRGRVSELPLQEIRKLNAGGERVPLLSEVLDAASGRVGLMIEMIAPGIAPEVVGAVQAGGFASPVLYASFLHAELLAVRTLAPASHTLALLEGIPVSGAKFAREAAATHVGLGFDSVTPSFVDALHDSGLTVFVYTLDDVRDIELAHLLGVDGIISDYPDRIIRK